MKITFSPAGTGGSWGTPVTLTAGLYASPENFALSSTSIVDTVQTLQATAVTVIDRGNEQNTISFQYTDEKADFAASEEDLLLYKNGLRFGLISFYSENDLTTPFAYMIGAVLPFVHNQVGVTTIRNFTIVGGQITGDTVTPPSPPPSPPPFGSGSGSGGGATTLYVQFKINIHNNSDNNDLIHIGDGTSDNYVAVNQNTGGSWAFYDDLSGNEVDDPSFTLDTWFTLDFKIDCSGSPIVITPRVNGTELATFNSTALVITSILIGSVAAGSINDHEFDDVKVGTTAYGSSDILSAGFASTIVPPFDSTTGTGISATGGVMVVNNSGTSAYATKALTFP